MEEFMDKVVFCWAYISPRSSQTFDFNQTFYKPKTLRVQYINRALQFVS